MKECIMFGEAGSFSCKKNSCRSTNHWFVHVCSLAGPGWLAFVMTTGRNWPPAHALEFVRCLPPESPPSLVSLRKSWQIPQKDVQCSRPFYLIQDDPSISAKPFQNIRNLENFEHI